MKKLGKGLRYSLTILSHPIRGFYEMRFEGEGNVFSCMFFLLLMIVAFVCQRQYTGFIFNTTDLREFNVLREVSNVLVPVLLWCTANWSITVLMDGEGRFVDIFMATCYATVPYTFTTLLGVAVSRVASADETTLLSILSGIGLVYSALLLFFGILTVHQFSVRRNVFAIILTVAGMVFIAFLALLFASILDNIIRYISGIVTEIQLRM